LQKLKHKINICWLRRDLRINDNHAFYEALKSDYPVLPLFIFDKSILNKLPNTRDKRINFIHLQLEEISLLLGSSLIALHDEVLSAFKKLTQEFDIQGVYTNHDYEPYAINRDQLVNDYLTALHIPFYSFKDQVIFEKNEILKSNQEPYTVFTPYSKIWKLKLSQKATEYFPSEELLNHLFKVNTYKIPSLEELGFKKTDLDFPQLHINAKTLRDYEKTRNFPALDATTHSSFHLRFGTISIRNLVKLASTHSQIWLNELIWREFFMMILYHFPKVVDHSFKAKYDAIPWRNNEEEFSKWCKGETGYPLVDAGMRELNETGWMHNRVRMVVASFLTKHLLIDWRWGEAYFAEKLLDYDLSANNGNWQWAAGCGCDAAPYFRIFNPTAQALKFDPQLIYIKKWIKDFDNHYQLITPIVSHDIARKRALEVYGNALSNYK
jgi:deoxyribodipyrimidine photo-lyase